MPRSKSPRKKRRCTLSEGNSVLKKSWLALYNQSRFVEEMLIDKNGNLKKSHALYNKLLQEYLLECQNESYLPSKDALEDKCQEIFYFASNKVQFSNIEPSRMDLDCMSKAFENGAFEVFYKKNEDEKLIADGYLIIDCREMSQDETNYIIEKFDARYDNELDSLTYQCLEYRVHQVIPPIKERKVKDYCIKRGKQDLIRLFNSERELSIKIQESMISKFRDALLLFSL